jgi:anti-sigma regulatory factor (Ser/Thr protein kinase)
VIEKGDELVRYRVSDTTDVAAAALQMSSHPILRGASSMDRAFVATMLSELGSNMVKYARRGTLSVVRREEGGLVDVEVVAQDEGPGISDIDRAMSDHYSSGGTLGLGLPGVRRMADTFTLRTTAGAGTEVRAGKRIVGRRGSATGLPGAPQPEAARPRASLSVPPLVGGSDRWELGARLRASEGHAMSGDRALSLRCDGGLLLAIIDASGHGPRAHALAAQLEGVFASEGSADLEGLLGRFDETLRGTVGAAAGLVFLDETSRRFRYLGVGNTRAALVGSSTWRGVSRDGVLGTRAVRYLPQSGTLAPGDLLLLWTDGLPEVGCTALAATLAFRPAQEIATALVSQLARPYDDAACLVLRWLP